MREILEKVLGIVCNLSLVGSYCILLVRMFITNLKSTLKIRLKAHIFPRTFADLLPLCYDYNTKH